MSQVPLTIVIGLDYSDHSNVALEQGFELASGDKNAELHVVTVLSPGELAGPNVPKSVLLDVEVASARLQRYIAQRWADFWKARLPRQVQPPTRVVSHVRFDQAAKGIVQLASDLSADLIIVGTHGRQGLARLLLGSVSENVLRLAACPVLVARPKLLISEDTQIRSPCAHCLYEREHSTTELWCEEHRTDTGVSHTLRGLESAPEARARP